MAARQVSGPSRTAEESGEWTLHGVEVYNVNGRFLLLFSCMIDVQCQLSSCYWFTAHMDNLSFKWSIEEFLHGIANPLLYRVECFVFTNSRQSPQSLLRVTDPISCLPSLRPASYYFNNLSTYLATLSIPFLTPGTLPGIV